MSNPILTVENVSEIFFDCLAGEDNKATALIVEGVINKFGFDVKKLESHKAEIATLLNELPEQFHQNSGGGWSFLNACVDKHDRQWGEHMNIEQLVVLGIGAKLAEWTMTSMRDILPGGMPYFVVKDLKHEDS